MEFNKFKFLQIESLKFHNEGIIQGNRKRKLKNWRIARKIFVNQNKNCGEICLFKKKSILHDLVQIMKN